jgi:hypothetical protein
MAGTECKIERERIAAQRRAAKGKPVVTRATVETLMNAMTPEGRAHVAAMAAYRLHVRPSRIPI